MKLNRYGLLSFTLVACPTFPFHGMGAFADDPVVGNSAKHEVDKRQPRIRLFPNAQVWNDQEVCAMEFPGFGFMGEYLQEDKALQVTPAGGRFYLSIYEGGLPGSGWNGHSIIHRWCDSEHIEGELQGWTKVDRSLEIVEKSPPEDAVVLFAGDDLSEWQDGKTYRGFLKAGTRTKRQFQDFKLYLEFLVPLKPVPPVSHPHRGNSGVFALGAYEVQIIDTFALDLNLNTWREMDLLKPSDTWCGAIYGIQAPKINMSFPPLTWQTLEIDFTAARFEGGEKVSSAEMTVRHNGILIHDGVKLPRGTGGGRAGPRPEVAEGPIVLQNHGNPNLFRNVWLQEL